MQLPWNTKRPATITKQVGDFLAAWSVRARKDGSPKGVFVLDGAKVSDAELGSPNALLPLIAWHADNLYRYAMRESGLGFQFIEDDESLLQRAVNLDKTDRCIAEVLCTVLEAAEDARKHLPKSASVPGAVELRGLVNQFSAQFGLDSTPGADAPNAIAKPQA